MHIVKVFKFFWTFLKPLSWLHEMGGSGKRDKIASGFGSNEPDLGQINLVSKNLLFISMIFMNSQQSLLFGYWRSLLKIL